MKISVVIPAYNEEERIGKCLEALKKQTRKPDEIIVVNNNSIDKTAEVAKSFGVTVLKQKKQGTINARNMGFNEAKFEIIVRTDADSIPHKRFIAEIIKYFKNHKEVDAVLGSHFYEGVPDIVNSAMFLQFLSTSQLILGHLPLIGPNMALRKDAWNQVKKSLCTKDSEVHEDIDISIHLNKIGKTIGFAPKAIVHASTRRLLKNPASFFIEYPNRARLMLKKHNVSVLNFEKLKKTTEVIPDIANYIKKNIGKL